MHRRNLLTATALAVPSLAGCTSDSDENGNGADDDPEGADTATDTPEEPTPTPMPREAFSSIFTNRLDETDYPDTRGAVVGFEETMGFVKYYVTEDDHEDIRQIMREIYDGLVEERDVGRDLEGRVAMDETREQWYTWRVEEAWAQAFLDGEIDEDEYTTRIDETEADWD